MMREFEEGKVLGRRHFVKIAAQSDRWKRRNVPAFIRESLFVPYYIAERGGQEVLHIIQFPIDQSEKVKFIPFARSEINEEEYAQISNR